MGDTIKLKAGKRATMPILTERELAYCKDENALYIGTPDGNKKVELSGDTILVSPNGTKYKLAVADDGVLSAEPITE